MLRVKNRCNRKIVLLGVLLSFLALTSYFTEVKATIDGWYDRYYYTQTIPVGMFYYHQFRHDGAISGSAWIVSSNGQAVLAYLWQAPWLFVTVTNKDTKPVTVTWVESFFVV